MAGPIQDVIEEDAADLQFPKGKHVDQNHSIEIIHGLVLNS